jgi:hypothetical protein
MQKHRGLFMSLALSAIIGLMGSQAQAGSITLSVDLNGVSIYTATSVSPDQNVQAILTTLNTALHAHGSAYFFTGLNAQSNFTGSSVGSLQTTFQLNTSGGPTGGGDTSAVLSIDTVQSGFLSPVGPGGTAISTAGGSYSTASGSLSYTSDFQAANTPTLVFPVSGTNSFSGNTGPVPIGSIPSGYQLSNHFLISLNQGPSVFLGGTGGILVTAVPEPSSIVTMLTGMPLPLAVVFGLIRRRRSIA